eukprot:CAMPEP_0181386098 /NCGR_PEP_ID=MMETSP1106-20121128/22942_1 /TAXON_ID=81844 /ORGANISM="Mantoniella antarctica, Strain SL-175" /LENGTH=395 /DNA_ID=CAMNT_0023506263 /DNA_START=168 /DNA_END=1352 /DNA_ORIENTATION=+
MFALSVSASAAVSAAGSGCRSRVAPALSTDQRPPTLRPAALGTSCGPVLRSPVCANSCPTMLRDRRVGSRPRPSAVTVVAAAADAEVPDSSPAATVTTTTSSDVVSTGEAPKSVWYGRALLIFVAAAYGSLSVAFKYVYSLPGPPSAGTIGAVRGVLAAACFIPMLLKDRKTKAEAGVRRDDAQGAPDATGAGVSSRTFWMAAAELAFWNLAAQGACNVALLFTDATRVSFLTQASIAFTPVLVSLSGDKVPVITWAGCALAIVGVVALGFDGGGSAAAATGSAGFNIGDAIALFGAASYSLYIFRISTFARQGLPGNLTQAWKTMILAVLYLGWAAADCIRWMLAPALVAAPWAGWTNPLAWAVMAFTAIVPGYLADICQAKGQESVAPSESQV